MLRDSKKDSFSKLFRAQWKRILWSAEFLAKRRVRYSLNEAHIENLFTLIYYYFGFALIFSKFLRCISEMLKSTYFAIPFFFIYLA